MKILVTGCNGQVGKCLVKQLEAKPDMTLLALGHDELDITNQGQVITAVSQFKPDVIINAAAYTAVDKAELQVEQAYLINRDGPKYLAQAAHQNGSAILHISTDYVFSGDKIGSYTETDPAAPQGVYGQSKLAGEIEVAQACKRHVILRTAWVFSEYGNNFVKTMLRLGMSRDSLSVVADQVGGPTYAGDIANALIIMAGKVVNNGDTNYGTYHFSGLPHVSWYEFAKTIFIKAKAQNFPLQDVVVNSIFSEEYPTPAKRPANSKLDTQKILNQFGIHASDWSKSLNNLSEYK